VARAKDTGDDWTPTAFPVEFLSLGTGGIGVPVRGTISSFGPILLSKVLGPNQTQESTLRLIFHWADQKGLPLLDLKDLRAVITFLTGDAGKPELAALGAVSATTAGVIVCAPVNLEADGADTFFGEPELDPKDHQTPPHRPPGKAPPPRAKSWRRKPPSRAWSRKSCRVRRSRAFSGRGHCGRP
jgi:DNA helicase HerA-like ATPase